ncbi:MAG: phytanoyl-CoA dioxygenase family protein [Filimonas sp.]|nr:phytanoyl-CoA dioxygenase family protein [Filimonas sp.]
MSTVAQLSPSTATGTLGIMHLKRYWEKTMARRNGKTDAQWEEEWNTDTTMLSMLGLGLEQTIVYLFNEAPSFETFEQWITDRNNGTPPIEKIALFNQLLAAQDTTYVEQTIADVLTADDLAHWEAHNYVIVRNAVPAADCDATIQLICDFLEVDINEPATWYRENKARQGIMVQLFQHAQLEANRQSPRIRRAYEQLWQRKDIWVNTDRVGFNPPQTESWYFPGPRLHWDVSLQLPIPFGTQGILYLSDTAANQGAFTLVPGFRHQVASWLHQLPADADPRKEDLYALGAQPVVANKGDFIIWDHALPHGSSVNTSDIPRFVQYINYAPLNAEFQMNWI